MQVIWILSGVILLSGCMAPGSEVSEPNGYMSYNSIHQSNANNSYRTINETPLINHSKSTYPPDKKTRAMEQEEYDAAIDNLEPLPEFILIHI